MPKNPKQLMLLAARSNGLAGPDMGPWHLKVSFTLFDGEGKTSDQGTIERFYVSDHKSKTVVSSTKLSQTNYQTEKGYLRAGSPNPESDLLFSAWREFFAPVDFSEKMIKDLGLEFDLKKRELGGTKLLCLTLGESGGIPIVSGPSTPSYCLDADLPIVRTVSRVGDPLQFVHNNVVKFRGRYLPGDLEVAYERKPILKMHLDRAETLKTINDADFIPPPEAEMLRDDVAGAVTVSTETAEQRLLKHPKPQYPPMARAAHVFGKVVLMAHIGTDGHVSSLYVVSGPAMLQQAALDAVWNWTYDPYVLNGKPMEVVTTINVTFPKSLTF